MKMTTDQAINHEGNHVRGASPSWRRTTRSWSIPIGRIREPMIGPLQTTNFINDLSMQSLEQGGIGLLITMLIISVPPMASNFFQGTLGSFMAYFAFNGAGSRPGPQGSYGHGGPSGYAQSNQPNRGNQNPSGFNTSPGPTSSNDPRLGGVGYSAASDTIRQGSGLANPPRSGG